MHTMQILKLNRVTSMFVFAITFKQTKERNNHDNATD